MRGFIHAEGFAGDNRLCALTNQHIDGAGNRRLSQPVRRIDEDVIGVEKFTGREGNIANSGKACRVGSISSTTHPHDPDNRRIAF